MKLMFKLGMPSNNAWNGRWSGEENLYARIVNFGTTKKAIEKAEAILGGEVYYYNFGDGWMASVTVTLPTPSDIQRVKKHSKGFCGYDWMIESIRKHGDIRVREREVSNAL